MFRENDIEFEKVNYFTEPLTEDELRRLLQKARLEPFEVLRRNEAAFKENGISADTPADQIIKLIVENPSLLQRPIVEVGDRAVLARPVEKVNELLNL